MCRIITETVSPECDDPVYIGVILSYLKLNITLRLIIRDICKLRSINLNIRITDQILRFC